MTLHSFIIFSINAPIALEERFIMIVCRTHINVDDFISAQEQRTGGIFNLGSLEIHVSTYISAKLKKRTYMYDSLQFPVEINTRGSKTLTTFIPFHTKYDLQEQFWLFSHSYLQNGILWLLNNFNILHDLKTDTFERCRHIYSFICMSLLTQ